MLFSTAFSEVIAQTKPLLDVFTQCLPLPVLCAKSRYMAATWMKMNSETLVTNKVN